MTEKQRIFQIEEHWSDYMHKQDFMYEEVLILKGNLERSTKIMITLAQVHRVTAGNVEFLLEKVNRIEDSQIEMKADIVGMKSDIGILKSKVSNLESDVAEIKFDMSEVKNTLGLILQKLDK